MNIRHVVMTGSVWALLCATQAFAAPPKDKDVAADSVAKNAIKALAETEKARRALSNQEKSEKCEGDCAVQTHFNDEAVILGVDPLSLITVTPGCDQLDGQRAITSLSLWPYGPMLSRKAAPMYEPVRAPPGGMQLPDY